MAHARIRTCGDAFGMRQRLTQQLTQLPSVRAGLVHVKCACRKGLSGGLRLQLAHRH